LNRTSGAAHYAVEGPLFRQAFLDVEVPCGNRHSTRRGHFEERLQQCGIAVGPDDLESMLGEQNRLLAAGTAQIEHAGALRQPQ
jgi:hypothetical protein